MKKSNYDKTRQFQYLNDQCYSHHAAHAILSEAASHLGESGLMWLSKSKDIQGQGALTSSRSAPAAVLQVTSSLHIMGKPHIEHSGIMKISNLQSSLAAMIKFEASSRLSWGESHQV